IMFPPKGPINAINANVSNTAGLINYGHPHTKRDPQRRPPGPSVAPTLTTIHDKDPLSYGLHIFRCPK
ncbi:MAG: hypothetical protein F7C81_00500, partial [Desulfurococcales archaeon]|nr:hypothetical protein [Desulfurococcales archaeon]